MFLLLDTAKAFDTRDRHLLFYCSPLRHPTSFIIQTSSMSFNFQSAATSAAPTSSAPPPVVHAIETKMALESGLIIDPILYDLVHGPHDAYIQTIGQYSQQQLDDLTHGSLDNSIQNIGQYQQQQPLYPPNNAYDLRQPNNASSNNASSNNAYNQIPQHSHQAAATPLPQTTETRKAPGPNVGQPVPARLNPLIAALRKLPPVSKNRQHPVRGTLKDPFKSDALTAAEQQLIRTNFISGAGTIRAEADLMGWYEDEAVFTKEYWRYLWKGESRAKSLTRKKQGPSKRQKTG